MLLKSECRPIVITALVGALAGCVSTSKVSSDRSDQSVSTIAGESIEGRFGTEEYLREAREAQAPVEWLTEAVAQSDAQKLQRAEAEALRARAAADRAAALAEANGLAAGAAAGLDAAAAAAAFRRAEAEHAHTVVLIDVQARRASFEAERMRLDAERSERLESWLIEADRARLEAEVAFEVAQSEHGLSLARLEQARAEHEAMMARFSHEAGEHERRLMAEAAGLRSEARAAEARARSGMETLAARMQAVEAGGESEAAQYESWAAGACEQAEARASAMLAEAVLLSPSALDAEYERNVSQARASKQMAMLEAQRLRETATEQLKSSAATLTRERLAVRAAMEDAELAHRHTLAEIEAEERLVRAQASIRLSRAAELEADAAVSAEYGEVSMEAVEAKESEILDFRLEAERLRDDGLSMVRLRRVDAERWLEAQREEAAASEMRIALVERETASRIKGLFDRAESVLARADVAFEQAMVSAQSTREAQRARAIELRIEADAVLQAASIEQVQHRQQAEAVRERSEQELASLASARAVLEHETRRQVSALLARATELEVRAEHDAQIAQAEVAERGARFEAEREGELVMIEARATMARATFGEQMAVASTLEGVAQARAEAMGQEHESALRRAEGEIRAAVAEADLVRRAALAQVEKAQAEAEAAMAEFAAFDAQKRARAEASEHLALAAVEQMHAEADAREVATIAAFHARLAGLAASRERAGAEVFLAEQEEALGYSRQHATSETADAALARIHAALRVLMEAGQGVAGVETE